MASGRAKSITQQEVARLAGVSRGTVSYVLNPGTASTVPISEETRKRVLKAAEELGYEPNVSAQNLRSGTSKTIGVLLPDMHNPFYWQLLEGLSRVIQAEGYGLLLYHSALMQSEEESALKELVRRRIDGVVLVSGSGVIDERTAARFDTTNKAVVHLATGNSPFDHVIGDYYEGMKILMEHLFELGHSRIGFVFGIATPRLAGDRLTAYYDALRDAGFAADEELVVTCDPTQPAAYGAAERLLDLKPRPTAIIGVNDLLAIAIVRACFDRGLGIPNDISVAGFDDIPIARYATPRLTTVHRDTEAQGELGARILMDRINYPDMPIREEYCEQKLIIGETTGACPNPGTAR